MARVLSRASIHAIGEPAVDEVFGSLARPVQQPCGSGTECPCRYSITANRRSLPMSRQAASDRRAELAKRGVLFRIAGPLLAARLLHPAGPPVTPPPAPLRGAAAAAESRPRALCATRRGRTTDSGRFPSRRAAVAMTLPGPPCARSSAWSLSQRGHCRRTARASVRRRVIQRSSLDSGSRPVVVGHSGRRRNGAAGGGAECSTCRVRARRRRPRVSFSITLRAWRVFSGRMVVFRFDVKSDLRFEGTHRGEPGRQMQFRCSNCGRVHNRIERKSFK